MTINSEVRVAGPFNGNGVTTSFPFTFKVFSGDEVLVVRETEGVELVLDLGADYTVALNADQDSAPGGSVDLPVPLPVGYTLSMTSALAPLQPVDLTNQGGFHPRVINASLDRLTILVQQLSERLGRTLVVPLSDGESGGTLPSANDRKGTVLAFNEVTGAPQVGPTIAAVGTVAANTGAINTVANNIGGVNTVAANVADVTNFADVYYGPSTNDPTLRRDGSPLQAGDMYFSTTIDSLRSFNGIAWRGVTNGAITVQNLSGDGIKTEFLLDYAPENEAVTSVFISGVYQQKNTYKLGGAGGSTLIFDAPPPAGASNIEVVVSGLQPSDDKLRQDLAASTGADLVGYKSRTVDAVLSERINVKDYGAVGDGVADDTAAIQSALDAAAGAPSASVYPYQCPPVWFPHGVYKTSSPLHATEALQLDGDNAIIKGMGLGFAAKSIPLAAGGAEASKALLIFLRGSKGDINGVLRWSAKVGRGLVLDCAEYAFPAIYIERMCYSHINCEIQGSSQNGLEVGPRMWGLNLDEITIENVTENCIIFLENSDGNGVSIKNPKIWGEFKESFCGIQFANGANCNGVSISGGFVEKVKYGILAGPGCGPVTVDGVGFEYCNFGVIRAVGSVADGRRNGPFRASNCFMHSVAGPKVYVDQAFIEVSGCRMWPGSVDFETDTGGRGMVVAAHNTYPGGLDIGTGSNFVAYDAPGSSRVDSNYLPLKITEIIPTYSLRNYQYRDAPYLQSSGLEFRSFYAGGGTEQYIGQSEWFVSEYQHLTTPGAITTKVGVVLDNFGGANAFRPSTDGGTSCGAATARWTQVYAFTGTINTSDEREKQQVRELSDAERAVALRLKSLLRAFKFNDSVAAKGDGARIHVGIIAQDVKAAFEEEGLVAEDYALLCYDEWPELQEQVAEDGSITQAYRAAGNRYGVRYEELLAFIISAM